jgi:nucleoside-diphosphate kinase
MIERTLVLVKPDGVQRSLVGKVVTRFEDAGLKMVGMKMVWMDREFAMKHYDEGILVPILGEKSMKDFEELGIKTDKEKHVLGKEVYEDLIRFSTEGPVVAMVIEGVHAVQVVRKIVGPTSPHRAQPGTIRGDFSPISMGYATKRGFGGRNLVHASGDLKDAQKEVPLWFKPEELHSYKTVHEAHTL